MGKTKKSATQAAEQAAVGQETTEPKVAEQEAAVQENHMDAEGLAVPDEAQEAAGPALERSGPDDEAELAEGVLQPYAVAFKGVLRLRQEPRPDAPIIAALPCGAGVFADGESGPDGWLHVLTGRLSGWMMAEYLEALPLPELDDEPD